MKPYDLKQYIIDNNLIINILEAIGCHHIKEYSKYISFGLPDSNNTSSTSIIKETLKTKIFSQSKEMTGDIYSLVMEIKNINFNSALRIIHEILNLPFTSTITIKNNTKKDILDIFKKACKKHTYCSDENLEIYNEDVCKDIINIPYLDWVKEGIMPYTQKEFGIGYSNLKNRVCIPWRYWYGGKNQFVGVMGRTLNENYKILGIPKYFPLVSFPKSLTLYGLQENYKYIQEAGVVIVFEAEKSVLKCHSLGIKNAVALGGHELSDEHIKILLSLNVTIIFAMDKDMEEDLSISMCNRVKIFRKTGYIYDEYGLLGEKDSPVDKGLKIFKVLYKRIKYIT